jgi:HEAT repeat protein
MVRRVPKEAIPQVIQKHAARSDGGIRWAAALAIGEIGPEAKVAVPTLIEILEKGSDPTTEYYVFWALGEIGPEAGAAVPKLIELLKRTPPAKDYFSKGFRVVWVLGRIGPEAAPAVPLMIEYLSGGGTMGASLTARALGEVGPNAKTAIPALYKLRRKTRDKELGKVINEAIGKIRGKSR